MKRLFVIRLDVGYSNFDYTVEARSQDAAIKKAIECYGDTDLPVSGYCLHSFESNGQHHVDIK